MRRRAESRKHPKRAISPDRPIAQLQTPRQRNTSGDTSRGAASAIAQLQTPRQKNTPLRNSDQPNGETTMEDIGYVFSLATFAMVVALWSTMATKKDIRKIIDRIRCTESSQVEKNGARHRMSHRYNPPRSYPPDLQSRLPRFPLLLFATSGRNGSYHSHVRRSTQTSQPCPPRHPKRRIPIRHDTPSAIGYNEEENLVHRRSPHGKNRNP